MKRLSWLRTLARHRFEILAGVFVGFLVLDLAADLAGTLTRAGHAVVSVLLVAFALVLVITTPRALRREAREHRRTEAERLRLEERLQLADRLEAVGRLAGGVAHDLNNQLTTVLGYCDLLALRLGRESPLQKDVAEIRRAGRRAASLIDRLLAFSRRKRITPKLLDLNAAVAEGCGLVRSVLGPDVELECRLAPEPLPVEADPRQLEQLVVDLASNAGDAMPRGGRLILATARRYLDSSRPGDLFDVVPGEYCRLVVADTGEGMDPETLAHAFEPFYTTKGIGEGSGLGLASVYGMVKQNRGYIWVDSRRGGGCRFEIYFPWAEETERADLPAALKVEPRPAAGATEASTEVPGVR